MSDKTYPYIGIGSQSKVTVLFYGNDYGTVMGGCGGTNSHREGDVIDSWAECNFREITREYLTNTYGKCESQEHVDFICELAGKYGFEVLRSGYKFGVFEWFSFYGNKLVFNSEFNAKKYDDSKLIHLPLPPKEKEMPETKQVYTKGMHERGELPSVGMELLIAYKGGNTFRGTIKYISNDGFVYERENGTDSFNGSVDIVEFKPIPTIEDELISEINKWTPLSASNKLAKELLSKYNITPK